MTTSQRERLAKDHPLAIRRDADLAVIQQIALRAVSLYAKHGVRRDELEVKMDLTAAHFGGGWGERLRLVDLLKADEANFLHDVAGINRELNHGTYEFENGFSPRFSKRA